MNSPNVPESLDVWLWNSWMVMMGMESLNVKFTVDALYALMA